MLSILECYQNRLWPYLKSVNLNLYHYDENVLIYNDSKRVVILLIVHK